MDRNVFAKHLAEAVLAFGIIRLFAQEKDDVRIKGDDLEFGGVVEFDKIENVGGLFSEPIQGPDDLGGHCRRDFRLHQDEKDFFDVALKQAVGDADVVANQMLDQIAGANQLLALDVNRRHQPFFNPFGKPLFRDATDGSSLIKTQVFQVVGVEHFF